MDELLRRDSGRRNANLILGLAKLFFGILKGTRERWGDLRADVAG